MVNFVVASETSGASGASPAFENPLHILVVEDDPESLQMMGALLSIWGYETTLTEAGPAALAAVEAAMPDVILLDLGLPGMDGFEVARSVRRLPGGGDSVLIVAVTAFRGEEHQRQAWEAGFNRYLMKPVDLDSLRQVLSQAHPQGSGGGAGSGSGPGLQPA
jgi:CheY-like chemotaxis protein